MTALTAAITGTAGPQPGLSFVPGGHWVYNAVLQTVFHINGGSASTDAQADVPGEPGSQVVQGETSGYVVGQSRITEFGKSSLSVAKTTPAPADEAPLGIESAGGPFLVYRNAGIVVRLGDQAATIQAGGPLGDPVVSSDGTLWLFRTATGLFCKLPNGSDRISACPAKALEGHTGALTLVADRPNFVDTAASTLQPVNDNGLGDARPLGVTTSAAARPASNDVAGRVAILDPQNHRMHLVDTRSNANPVSVSLPDTDFDGPASTGSMVVLVDRKNKTVLTYDSDGKQRDAKSMPKENGNPRLSRGQDSRVYVEGAEGTHVMVVDREGKVADVSTDSTKKPAPAPREQTTKTPPPGPSNPPSPTSGKPNSKPKPAPTNKPKPTTVPVSPPGAPRNVSATAATGSATVTWDAAPANGSPVSGYRVSWQGSAGGSGAMNVDGGSGTARLGGLNNGERYTISVAATNSAGFGPAASANPITPVGPAAAPGNLTARRTSSDTVTILWSAPNLGGGTLDHYHVIETYANGQGAITLDQDVTGTTATCPTPGPGARLTITVYAITRTPDGQVLTGAQATTVART